LTPLVLSSCVISSNLNSLAKLSVKSLHFPVLKTVSLLSAAQLTHRSVHPLQSVWLHISDPNFVTRGCTVHVSSGRVGKSSFLRNSKWNCYLYHTAERVLICSGTANIQAWNKFPSMKVSLEEHQILKTWSVCVHVAVTSWKKYLYRSENIKRHTEPQVLIYNLLHRHQHQDTSPFPLSAPTWTSPDIST
jgi:hypothetical protein